MLYASSAKSLLRKLKMARIKTYFSGRYANHAIVLIGSLRSEGRFF
jgi:hypothetical protein